jgi:hypothetical protein
MQLDTQKKKIIGIAAAIGLVLLSGTVMLYAIKHQANNTVKQQTEVSTPRTKQITAATNAEKGADALFADGDMAGAKAKYQTAANLYAETKNTEGAERVKMQISFIDSRQDYTATKTTDLSGTPVDRNLDAKLGVPPLVAQP